MKAITELGISPAPWHVNQGQSSDDMWCEVRGKEVGDIVCDCMIGHGYEQIKANARLIESAPMLYEVAAWCREQADEIGKCCISGGVNPYALAQCMAGIIRRCEAALAAASGESEEGETK